MPETLKTDKIISKTLKNGSKTLKINLIFKKMLING